MKLTGKVVKIESGNEFVDGVQRVYVRVANGDKDSMYSVLRVPNHHVVGYLFSIDDEIELELLPAQKQLSRAAS